MSESKTVRWRVKWKWLIKPPPGQQPEGHGDYTNYAQANIWWCALVREQGNRPIKYDIEAEKKKK